MLGYEKVFTCFMCVFIGAGYYSCVNKQGRPCKIVFVGDILLARGVGEKTESFGYDYPYDKIKGILKDSDLTIGNLECAISSRGTPLLKGKPSVQGSTGKCCCPEGGRL